VTWTPSPIDERSGQTFVNGQTRAYKVKNATVPAASYSYFRLDVTQAGAPAPTLAEIEILTQ
jgi:hypothetical protein